MKKIGILGSYAGIVLAAGCVSAPPAPGPDLAFESLNRVSSEIQDSWAQIGAIKQSSAEERGVPIAPDSYTFGPKLSKRITLRWSGDARPVLDLLTREGGVQLKVTGKPPPSPLPPVYIEVHEARIGDVVRDIGYQLRDSVQIVLNAIPDHESVELVYAPRS